MARYEISLGVLMTIFEDDSFDVVADSEEEAIEIAKERFRHSLENKYAYVDYEDATVDNVKILED